MVLFFNTMYFLNGDRIYIKPENAREPVYMQFLDCVEQIKNINSGKKIFKLNFFVDATTDKLYNNIKLKVCNTISTLFSNQIISNVIAQPPLTSSIIAEVFLFDPKLWKAKRVEAENGAAILFKRENTQILVGNIQSNQKEQYITDAQAVFRSLGKLLDQVSFSLNSIVRQWNYLEDILGFESEKQKYQEFNNVRSEFYGNSFEKTGYPAATGIGMNSGGIIVEFVAVKSDELITMPIDNPEQIAAHQYSKNVLVGEECILKTTPKFERARYFELFGKRLIFISGTASITGEKTVGVNNPVLQTQITIENIKRLYNSDILKQLSSDKLQPKYGHARVYVKNRKDFSAIKKTFKTYYGNLPVVYIIANICRPDLLVEIEGKVILQ